jgi:uncharacterized protein
MPAVVPAGASGRRPGSGHNGRRRAKGGVRGVVLTPGAGASREQPALVAIERRLGADGITVDRIDFPYRIAGRRSPDRPPVLIGAVSDAVRSLAERLDASTSRIAAGGRSMGGRMCSMAVAEGLAVLGLVLISYPLHPPGRPERSRTEHFPLLEVPCLFVSGTRDAFGSPGELEEATSVIPGTVTHIWIDGGDHGLRGRDEAVAESVRDWLCAR